MALFEWPGALAKISRLDLRIEAPQHNVTSPLSGRQMRGARFAEHWTGAAVLAPRGRGDLAALAAFVAGLRGRNEQFQLPLTGGFAGRAGVGGGVVVSGAATGETITVNFDTNGLTLRAGTLMQIGTIVDEWQQVVEVLEDVTTGNAAVVKVAPRLRQTWAAGEAITTGSVVMRCRLAEDGSAPATLGIGYGSMTLDFVEVPFVTAPIDRLIDAASGNALQDDDLDYLLEDVG